jgi:hypothetical protein
MSAADEELFASLREMARQAIAHGTLPNVASDYMWGGTGSGAPCGVCSLPIRPDQAQVRIGAAQDTGPKFHGLCHQQWRQVCAELTQQSQ